MNTNRNILIERCVFRVQRCLLKYTRSIFTLKFRCENSRRYSKKERDSILTIIQNQNYSHLHTIEQKQIHKSTYTITGDFGSYPILIASFHCILENVLSRKSVGSPRNAALAVE